MRSLKSILPVVMVAFFMTAADADVNRSGTASGNPNSTLSADTDSPLTDPSQPHKILIPVIKGEYLSLIDKISEPNYAEDKLFPGLPVFVKVDVLKRSQQSLDDSTIALTPESKSKIERSVDNLFYRVQDSFADSLSTNNVYQRGEIRFIDIDNNKSFKCADVLITAFPRNIVITKIPNKGCQLFSHEFLVKNDDGRWSTKLEVYLEIDNPS